jgi:predicted ATPase
MPPQSLTHPSANNNYNHQFFFYHINPDFYNINFSILITKKIVITGGPGTGKSSIINKLIKRSYICLEEISRQVTLDAKADGIDQLFLTHPLLFSERLLEGRKQQFLTANTLDSNLVFIDRGIPDIVAYMDYVGDNYPQYFIDACKNNTYDHIFILKPWKAIYTSDQVRYENFEQAETIHTHLLNTYQTFKYQLNDVPFDTIEKRTDYIIKALDTL